MGFLPKINAPVNSLPATAVAPKDPWTEINFFQDMNKVFQFSAKELELLEENSFIVLNREVSDDIIDILAMYWFADLPVLVTTDLMLQVWHLIFDNSLKKLESQMLIPMLENLTEEMITTLMEEINLNKLEISEQDMITYLLVANRISDVESTVAIPSQVNETVTTLVETIYAQTSFTETSDQFSSKDLAWFIDDYSAYRPQGHYTESPTLEQYYRLFKWLSRHPFLFDHCLNDELLQRTPLEMIKSSLILTWCLKHTEFAWENNEITGMDIWDRFDHFLDVLIGTNAQITPFNLDTVCTEMKGEQWHFQEFKDDDLEKIQTAILTNNSIPLPKDDALIVNFYPDAPVHVTPKTMYFIGERYTLDTKVMEEVVSPYIQNKWYPSGLEVAATCMYSERAKELLPMASQQRVDALRAEIQAAPAEEKQALTWKLQETLAELAVPTDTLKENESYTIPQFMQANAWNDEKLTTVLGTWAQLRHDTVLYLESGYGMAGCSTPAVYVEPYPAFYEKLGQLSVFFATALEPLKMYFPDYGTMGLSYDEILTERDMGWTLSYFYDVTNQLANISQHELVGDSLSEEEISFLQCIFDQWGGSGDLVWRGWIPNLLWSIDKGMIEIDPEENYNPDSHASVISNVFVDPNSEPNGIVQVGTGAMEHVIAIVPDWVNNSKKMMVVGPVFSYYEFRSNVHQQLNDQEWRTILETPQDFSNFDASQITRGPWASTYMPDTSLPTTFYSGLIESEFSYSSYNLTKFPVYPDWITGSSTSYFQPNYADLNLNSYGAYDSSKPEFMGWDLDIDPQILFDLLYWKNETSLYPNYPAIQEAPEITNPPEKESSKTVSGYPEGVIICIGIGGIYVILMRNQHRFKKKVEKK